MSEVEKRRSVTVELDEALVGEAARRAGQDGVSTETFISEVVAMRLRAIRRFEKWERRKSRPVTEEEEAAEAEKLRRVLAILNRAGTNDPIEGDEVPDHLKDRLVRP